ncbi:MAG: hypothetical protein GY760_14085 [Deltaproteobacteria bacterium]|nr:hypothetical protein [Deltaproteobacteria bacterium]
MKNLLFIVLTLFIIASCAKDSTIDSGPDPELISKDKYVILKSGDWTPSKSDSKRALIAVEQYIQNSTYENIKKNIAVYKVQLIGIRKNGKNKIYCNFFGMDISNWKSRSEKVVIKDGGFWVWNIIYNPETNICSDMYVNGEG